MSNPIVANTLPIETVEAYVEFMRRMEQENLIHSKHLCMHTIRHLYIDGVHEYTAISFSNEKKTEFPLWVVFDNDWMYNTFTRLPDIYRWLADYYDTCTIVEYFMRGLKWEQVQRGTFFLDHFVVKSQ